MFSQYHKEYLMKYWTNNKDLLKLIWMHFFFFFLDVSEYDENLDFNIFFSFKYEHFDLLSAFHIHM